MSDLNSLKASILEDGVIDADEVKEIKAVIYADGVIDQEEADFLFDLNDAVSGNDNDASWGDLFVEAICGFLLEDDISPGVIDDEESIWLFEKVVSDGELDDIEKRLLNTLKEKAKNFPQKLEALLG